MERGSYYPVFKGQFHIIMVNKLMVLDYRIKSFVHTCMIAENVYAFSLLGFRV